MRLKVLTVIAGIFLFIPYALSGQEITIDINKGKKVSPVKYGFHYEEIGMLGDGGLYAELVRNRGFEEANPPRGMTEKDGIYLGVFRPDEKEKEIYRIDPLVGWIAEPVSYSPVKISRVADFPLNKENPHSILVNVTGDFGDYGRRAVVRNTGYYGMCFREGKKYKLSFYVRSNGYRGTLNFCLSDANGNSISADASFSVTEQEWKKYTAELVATADVDRGMLTIIPEKAGRFQLDMVSLFPADTWDNGKSVFRKDIMQNLVDYAPSFLRFPGGCLVHGVSEGTMYHWKETLGDISRRPGGWSKWEPHYRTDGIGYHEFYELCEYLGADAMYVTSTGMICSGFVHRDRNRVFDHAEVDLDYYIQDALDAIEYAIGAPDTRWGAERARNGHSEPFPLKYVEIGNEDFGPVYYERYDRMYQAIKEKYPQLILIAGSIIGEKFDDKRKYLPEFKSPDRVDVYDEHYYQDVDWAINNYRKFDAYDRRGPALFVGELGLGGKYPQRVLAESIVKMGLERNGDLNPIMADRPLMRNWDFLNRGFMVALLLHNTSHSAKTLKYYLCRMFRDNTIDFCFNTVDCPDINVYATAGKDSKTGDYVIKVLNLSDQNRKIKVKIPAIKKGVVADITVLTAGPDDFVTPERPDAVKPVSKSRKVTFPVSEELGACSFTVYRLKGVK